MTHQQLRARVAVARAGAFGGAALDLGRSQAAVSRSVATPELRFELRQRTARDDRAHAGVDDSPRRSAR